MKIRMDNFNLYLRKYDQLVVELSDLLNLNCSFLYSAIIYGSYCRHEICSIFSDIDLLCIIKSEFIHQNEISRLYDIVAFLPRKYDIKIHLRIRNLSDLYTKESGLFDCGFSSSINKLRDGVVIYGSSMDSEYLKFINNITEEEYVMNLKLRFSDLKYQNRALISLIENYENTIHYENILKYKSGCILFQLAELICYTCGMHFVSSADALSKAHDITANSYFKKAINIKQGKEPININHFISTIDEIINSYSKKIVPNNVIMLKRIVLHNKESFNINDNLFGNMNEPIMELCHIKFKKSIISMDGTLHILTK